MVTTQTTRTQRLRSAADIRRTVGARCAAGSGCLVVHARVRDDDGPARVAVVAGRRVGNAVDRNRAKRRLREAVRCTAVPDGMDLVVSAKSGADSTAFPALVDELQQCMRRALNRARNRAVAAQ